MLMKRICPFCKSELTVSSRHFCEYCGNTLPDNLHLEVEKPQLEGIGKETPPDASGVKISNTDKKPLSKSQNGISIRSAVAGVVLGISISTMLFLVFQTSILKDFQKKKIVIPKLIVSKTAPVVQNQNKPVEDNEAKKNYLEMGLSLKSGNFGQNDIHTFVPYETPFYIEFNDSSTLDPYFSFLGGEFFTLAESLKGKIQPFYVAFYMKRGISTGWVLLTFPEGDSFEVGSFKDISTDVVDGVLVISPDPVFIDEVRLARSEITKNLSMHPLLISTKSSMPKEGQIFMLKTSKDGDTVIEDLFRKTLSSEFKSVLDNFKKGEESYLVIK